MSELVTKCITTLTEDEMDRYCVCCNRLFESEGAVHWFLCDPCNFRHDDNCQTEGGCGGESKGEPR